MRQIEKAIFPGLFLGCIMLILIASLAASPKIVEAYDKADQLMSGHSPLGNFVSNEVNPQINEGDTQTGSSAATPAQSITKKIKAATSAAKKSNKEKGNALECSLHSHINPSVLRWCNLIDKYAHQNNLDPALIAALITQESGGEPQAYSSSGAVGLMQVMPRDGIASGFMCPLGPCFASRPSISELTDPEYNISYGTRFLAGLVQKYGSPREALRAYGPANVGYYYADLVLSLYQTYQ